MLASASGSRRGAMARAALLCVWFVGVLVAGLMAGPGTLSHGRFTAVRIYRPRDEPTQFVLLLSGQAGVDATVEATARRLTAQGALVAAVDTAALVRNLDADGGQCVFPDGDLENLSHFVQGYTRQRTYRKPILVGLGEGAALARAVLAQAPAETFAGAISVGFCPDLNMRKPLCDGEGSALSVAAQGRGLQLLPASLSAPWIVIPERGAGICEADRVAQFVAQSSGTLQTPRVDGTEASVIEAFAQFANNDVSLPVPPDQIADLPIVEVPAQQGAADQMAVLLSGDGGWAGIDEQIAAALAQRGVDVVGFDSLRYFWKRRTPEGLAADLERLLHYYAMREPNAKMTLVGYSQGADVLPFAVNRLSADARARVSRIVLMSPGIEAAFEFHVGNGFGAVRGGLPILPEAQRLPVDRTRCLYGQSEAKDSLCPQLIGTGMAVQALAGGHHFDGAYGALAQQILGDATSAEVN
jgi:type IV secretory pathway VirJ component